ncbi:hypothetical protein [Limobrevibacterium gyesilva]|uniref:RNA-binding protein n=1 Tax=Limobrevibacterium gyesilva TaxID=2991712 RepID=A0AA41YWH1_9PROT|nr:hypothetical protein [Limobrevibacterium gyesilva]MCW3476637.1 hypothetical protein [Limobrevibacterium gyesilva]
MRTLARAAAAVLVAALPVRQAQAWYHSGGYGGFEHATSVTPEGVAHGSNYGGYAHGTAVGPEGAAHVSDYGGAWHGTTAPSGAYYHQPVVVNHYGATGCYNCGGGGWGVPAGAAVAAGAAGVAVGAMAGAASANAAAANAAVAAAYPMGATYAALPAGCGYSPYGGKPYYFCGRAWMTPAYGANGVYYLVVPAP